MVEEDGDEAYFNEDDDDDDDAAGPMPVDTGPRQTNGSAVSAGGEWWILCHVFFFYLSALYLCMHGVWISRRSSCGAAAVVECVLYGVLIARRSPRCRAVLHVN